jgi:hypothetical protein
MGSLTQKITQIMTAPDQVNGGAAPNNSFIAFCSPGIAINEAALNFGDMSTKDQINANSAFSQLVNNIPDSAGFWGLTDKKVWDIYNDAISQITLPVATLTTAQATELKKAQDFLVQLVTSTDPFTGAKTTALQDTVPYAAYKMYQTAYIAALTNYNGLQIQANAPGASNAMVQAWSLNGNALQSEVVSAWNNWIATGNKNYVEEAIGIISNLAGQGPQSMYAAMNANYTMNSRKDVLGETFYPTFVYPVDPLQAALNGSWLTYEFNLSDVDSFQSKSASNSGGGASGSWGLWSGGASASFASGQTHATCDTTGLSVSVQLLQVPLSRAWLESEIFWSRGWKFSPASGLGLVSDGDVPPQGLMALFPTAVILAQNLQINLDMTNAANASQFSSQSESGSIGWGPFSVNGNHSESQSSSSSSFTKTDSGIQVPGPQIIGFVCQMLPLSPNPDPSLAWPT